ncbi:hypothetical protein ID866_9322 [Astraeus odoratus]|nr:hypothetical protein ID866_9322 [Astraeus odoratus]
MSPAPLVRVPLPVPRYPNASSPPELNEKEKSEYDAVLAHFADPGYVLPGVPPAEGSLLEEERMWLSYECLLRYIRATKHDVAASIKRLEDTLKWRREFGIYDTLTADLVEPEGLTGKEFLFGYDTLGRPGLYMCPSAALIAHLPWLLHTFYKLITPFIDPLTRSKMVFNPVRDDHGLWRSAEARDKREANKVGAPNAKVFELDQLVRDGWQGSQEFKYEHAIYWPAIVEMCKTRREAMTRVWKKMGGVVGIKEWDVKVGVQDEEADEKLADQGQ